MLDHLRWDKQGPQRGDRRVFATSQVLEFEAPDDHDYRLALVDLREMDRRDRELVLLYVVGLTQREMRDRGHSWRRIRRVVT